jgi:hypothetical protein
MNCPFCKSVLKKTKGCIDRNNIIRSNWNHYYCNQLDCLNDEMPRFIINYKCLNKNQDGQKIYCTIMIDNYYVQIDWEHNISIISKLKGAILFDPITINSILDLDLDDLQSMTNRIQTLMLFS